MNIAAGLTGLANAVEIDPSDWARSSRTAGSKVPVARVLHSFLFALLAWCRREQLGLWQTNQRSLLLQRSQPYTVCVNVKPEQLFPTGLISDHIEHALCAVNRCRHGER